MVKKVNAISKKADYNAKINDIEVKIINLDATIDLMMLEIIYQTLVLLPEAEYDTEVVNLEKKLDHDHSNNNITNQKFKNLAAKNFKARLRQANLLTKAKIADFVQKTDFGNKVKNFNKKIYFK